MCSDVYKKSNELPIDKGTMYPWVADAKFKSRAGFCPLPDEIVRQVQMSSVNETTMCFRAGFCPLPDEIVRQVQHRAPSQ